MTKRAAAAVAAASVAASAAAHVESSEGDDITHRGDDGAAAANVDENKNDRQGWEPPTASAAALLARRGSLKKVSRSTTTYAQHSAATSASEHGDDGHSNMESNKYNTEEPEWVRIAAARSGTRSGVAVSDDDAFAGDHGGQGDDGSTPSSTHDGERVDESSKTAWVPPWRSAVTSDDTSNGTSDVTSNDTSGHFEGRTRFHLHSFFVFCFVLVQKNSDCTARAQHAPIPYLHTNDRTRLSL
jgi:hypothetical protein